MRRMILLGGTASFLMAFLGGTLAFSLAAPSLVAAQKGQQLSGSWLQTLDPPGPGGGNALMTFGSDGTIVASSGIRTADSLHRLSSSGHGNWTQIGEGEFAATWLVLPLRRGNHRLHRFSASM